MSKLLDRGIEIDLSNQTPFLLKKYSWDLRTQQENTLISDSAMLQVQKYLDRSFINDFKWSGEIPFISFANMIGLRNNIMKSDDDSLVGVVAPPGKGKSTFACGIGRLIDPTFTNEYIIFTMDQLKAFLRKATNIFNQVKKNNAESEIKFDNPLSGKVVVLDEGLYLLFSGDSNTKEGKLATKLFSIIRALGIIFIVNITNWGRISKGVKEDRFKGLFRIPVKGIVQFFSQKRIAKIDPKKNEWPKPNFYEKTGYIDNSCQFWKDYDQNKADFLFFATHEI